MSCTAGAADEAPKDSTVSTFDSFQQIQTLIRESFCPEVQYSAAKKELIEISESDQADRVTVTPEMSENDTKRRAKVAAIAAQGCLKDKDDYFTAAVIFQHGTLPEHYLQAIAYAGKSAELGHPVGGPMREATIDRYLMSLGYKQIFGSQVTAPVSYKQFEDEKDMIACLWPIEDKIDLVEDYNFGTQDYRLGLRKTLEAKQQQIPECDFQARDSKAMLSVLTNLKI